MAQDEKKDHWFCFTFLSPSFLNVASRYLGLSTDNVTREDIQRAKELAEVPESSVLLSVSYLGFMTEKEFKEE